MMVRTQIALDAEDHRWAKQRAAELGVSLAGYVRSTMRKELGDPSQRGDISEIFGIADSGGSDISRNKDRYVADAVETQHARKRGDV